MKKLRYYFIGFFLFVQYENKRNQNEVTTKSFFADDILTNLLAAFRGILFDIRAGMQ